MGAVDLVVQVESPRSVARGIQRVGRAGHRIDVPSSGRIFPKFRGDLLECAAVVARMRTGDIEHTAVPQLPLDVLAQQLVAVCVEEEWSLGDLAGLICGRRAPFDSDSLDKLICSAWYSSARIAGELGYAPSLSFEQALPDLVASYRGTSA